MSPRLEDIWNNCIVVNAKIGKHKTPWLFCTGWVSDCKEV